MYSADRGHSAITKLLIDHGAAVDTQRSDNGWTATHFAAAHNYTAALKVLLEARADAALKNVRNSFGIT